MPHPIMAMQIAENNSRPGQGRILTAAISFDYGDGTGENIVIYSPRPVAPPATLRRFPDIIDIRFPCDRTDTILRMDSPEDVGEQICQEIEDFADTGGILATWDAPIMFERIRRFEPKVPEKVLDLKLLQRLLLPVNSESLTLFELADHLDEPMDRNPGLLAESEAMVIAGSIMMDRLTESPDGPHVWHSIMEAQTSLYGLHAEAVRKRMKAKGKSPHKVRAGWPMWDKRGPVYM